MINKPTEQEKLIKQEKLRVEKGIEELKKKAQQFDIALKKHLGNAKNNSLSPTKHSTRK